MRYRSIAILLTSVLAACAQSGRPPVQAGAAKNVPFACPAPGTAVRTTTAAGAVTNFTWSGSDQSDPATCLTTLASGKQTRLLYGFYTLPFDGDADARSAFKSAFGGSTSDSCFNVTTTSIGASSFNNKNTYRRCIKQIGPATIAGDPAAKNVVAFELSDQGMAGNSFSGVTTLYYDVDAKMFVKTDFTLLSGAGSGGWTRRIVAKDS